MSAGVVDRVEIPFNIKDGNELSVNIHAFSATWFHVAGVTKLNEIGHPFGSFLTKKFRLLYVVAIRIQEDSRAVTNGKSATVAAIDAPVCLIATAVPVPQKSF